MPSLLYVDLSTKQKKSQPIVFQDKYYKFKKDNSIQLYQDDSYFYVILKLYLKIQKGIFFLNNFKKDSKPIWYVDSNHKIWLNVLLNSIQIRL